MVLWLSEGQQNPCRHKHKQKWTPSVILRILTYRGFRPMLSCSRGILALSPPSSFPPSPALPHSPPFQEDSKHWGWSQWVNGGAISQDWGDRRGVGVEMQNGFLWCTCYIWDFC